MASAMVNHMTSMEKMVDEHNQTLQEVNTNLEQVTNQLMTQQFPDMEQIKNLFLGLQNDKNTPDA
jgi:uncharacterized protein YwgA